MIVRIKKHADGSAVLTCLRANGTATWHRQKGALGAFFPLHDLTHYAVETTLGYRRGFYGLVAEGWELDDFGGDWPRGQLPPEAGEVELLVGLLDMERGSGERWSAAQFVEQAALHLASTGLSGTPPFGRNPSDTDLDRVRDLRHALFAQWAAVAPGDALALPFPDPAGN